MKKIVVMLFLLLFVTGCNNLKDYSIPELVNVNITKEAMATNQVRTGYKYYLPKGMSVRVRNNDFNEIIKSGSYYYFLYVDVVSYYNKVNSPYEIDDKAVFSRQISYQGKYGYYEINTKNDKSLIEIMYNYAKIEVIVENRDINLAISRAMNILTSINYSDAVLDNLMGDNVLMFNEIEFNIFETKKDVESNYLTAIDDHGQWVEPVVPDTDLIN